MTTGREEKKLPRMLSGCRALDLTDEKGFLCGKMLADLGVDVIKIERPGGDPSRRMGPFWHDVADPERSLYWFAYNTNKRGITLDIETAKGRDILLALVREADFLIEFLPARTHGRTWTGLCSPQRDQQGDYRDLHQPLWPDWTL